MPSRNEDEMQKKIALTGIKPTGTPHIGNYIGAIRPALKLAETCEARYFIADYHALNAIKDAEALKDLTYEIASAWLACGLDPQKVLIYRQSQVPETFELLTLLLAFTPKGLMNRAHAYKAMLQKNREEGNDPDDGVNMGLFTYPVLMAADILLFDTDYVPVGNDQYQHIEMAVDIAESFNFIYKCQGFKLPTPLSTEQTKTVIGLDGRKMSKSYGNIIPLFASESDLKKLVMRIVTNSQTLEEPKDPETCNVFALYRHFATPEQVETLRQRYLAGGMGWGHAKNELLNVMNEALTPLRNKYNSLIQNRDFIDEILLKGSHQARELAQSKISVLRKIVGLA
jgi:tryptophanyl-tRNA synthetase